MDTEQNNREVIQPQQAEALVYEEMPNPYISTPGVMRFYRMSGPEMFIAEDGTIYQCDGANQLSGTCTWRSYKP